MDEDDNSAQMTSLGTAAGTSGETISLLPAGNTWITVTDDRAKEMISRLRLALGLPIGNPTGIGDPTPVGLFAVGGDSSALYAWDEAGNVTQISSLQEAE